jgi:hypothetical protein
LHVVRAPYPNNHPEDRATAAPGKWSVGSLGVTLSEWAYLGLRLANATMKISAQVEIAHAEDNYMKLIVNEYTKNLAERVRNWEKDVDGTKGYPSLIEIATPLVKDADKAELTPELAGKILQEKIVEESNRNWEPRATPTTIWDWTRKREPSTEQYFSVDRWTPSIQHMGDTDKENMYLEWARNQSPDDSDDGHSHKRRKLIPGEPAFPLGETAKQQEAISNRIDGQLRGRTYYPFLSLIYVLVADVGQLGIRSLMGYMGLRGPILEGRRLPERLRRRRRRRRRHGPEHRLQGERGRNQSHWLRPMSRLQGERGRSQSQRFRLSYRRQTRVDAPRPEAQKGPVAQMEEPQVQRETHRRGQGHRWRETHRRR